MRFFDNGPDIPDDLLQARDNGDVVFLCGAGVSCGSGMPSFPDLTDFVIKGLRVAAGSPIIRALEPWLDKKYQGPRAPLDQIFRSIYDDHPREVVDEQITKRLQIRDDGSPSVGKEHAIIARISADRNKRPRIVTTNFDLLFEHALKHALGIDDPVVQIPPVPPIIDAGQRLANVIHLHGQLQTDSSIVANYIVSSSHFGSAYLSEGWAARFLRSLLYNFTVVFVGYGADDFPVDYLLQGLTHRDLGNRNTIYAFWERSDSEVEPKWRHRGVTMIPYSGHDTLWKTLEAWAVWADDPIAHRKRITQIATTSPRDRTPVERGQVMSLVRSKSGARAFANAEPPPHPEWIFVLDTNFRTTGTSLELDEDQATSVPSEEYGIDTDPDHAPQVEDGQPPRIDHLLAALPSDDTSDEPHQISNPAPPDYRFVPQRLQYLMDWIGRCLESPIVAWWVRQQQSLHPVLVRILRAQLDNATPIHPNARMVWNSLLEYHSDQRRLNKTGLAMLEQRIANEGWTLGALRQLDAWAAPFLDVDPAAPTYDLRTLPSSWEKISTKQFLGMRVSFPDDLVPHLHVPQDSVESVLSIMERHLQQASNMHRDLGTTNFEPPRCYPGRESTGELLYRETDSAAQWVLHLFTQLSKDFPAIARSHANVWPSHDRFFFRNLTLFALNQKLVFDANEVVAKLNELPQSEFWNFDARRELMFLLADRWTEFSLEQQQALVDRLLRGSDPKVDDDSDRQPELLQLRKAAWYTTWLIKRGCEVPNTQQDQLAELTNRIPGWQDDEASDLTVEHGVEFAFLGPDISPNPLLHTPPPQLIDQAKRLAEVNLRTFVHSRPFIEVVEEIPRNALEGLKSKMNSDEYPAEYWDQLLLYWPTETDPNLLQDLLQTVAQLPHEIIRALGPSFGWWVANRWTGGLVVSEEWAWPALDNIIAALHARSEMDQADSVSHGQAAPSQNPSKDRILNHPVGKAAGKVAEGLLTALASQGLTRGGGLPNEYAQRLEKLLSLPSTLAHHPVRVLAHDVSWLYQVDQEWTERNLIPCFDVEHSFGQAAWNGLASTRTGVVPSLIATMNKYLIQLFPEIEKQQWEEEVRKYAARAIVSQFLVDPDVQGTLTDTQIEDCLRKMSKQTRASVIYDLGRWASHPDHGWTTFFIPFVENVWPKASACQSDVETRAWIYVLNRAGDAFPTAFESVRSFLAPLHDSVNALLHYRRDRDDQIAMAKRFPDAVLKLVNTIIPDNPRQVPYDLRAVLHMLEEAKPELRSSEEWQRLIHLAH